MIFQHAMGWANAHYSSGWRVTVKTVFKWKKSGSYASFNFQYWLKIVIFFVEKMNEHHQFLFTKTDSFKRKNQFELKKNQMIFFNEFNFCSISQPKSHVHGATISRLMYVGDASVTLFQNVSCSSQMKQFFFDMAEPLFSRIFDCWCWHYDHFSMIDFCSIYWFHVPNYVFYNHMALVELDWFIFKVIVELFVKRCMASFDDFTVYVVFLIVVNYNWMSRFVYWNCNEVFFAKILFCFFFHSDFFNGFFVFEYCYHFSTIFTWIKFNFSHFNSKFVQIE